eukprot:5807023-Pyramimonas_sp.AAC.1
MAYPAKHKDPETTKAAFLELLAASDEVKRIYAGSSGELLKARRLSGWRRDASAPHRPQTNIMAEHAAKSVIQVTRAVLHNSVLGHEWRNEVMQAWRSGRNYTARPRNGAAATQKAYVDDASHE